MKRFNAVVGRFNTGEAGRRKWSNAVCGVYGKCDEEGAAIVDIGEDELEGSMKRAMYRSKYVPHSSIASSFVHPP